MSATPTSRRPHNKRQVVTSGLSQLLSHPCSQRLVALNSSEGLILGSKITRSTPDSLPSTPWIGTRPPTCELRQQLQQTSSLPQNYVRQLSDISSSDSSSHQVRFLKPLRKNDVTALSFSSSSLCSTTIKIKKQGNGEKCNQTYINTIFRVEKVGPQCSLYESEILIF